MTKILITDPAMVRTVKEIRSLLKMFRSNPEDLPVFVNKLVITGVVNEDYFQPINNLIIHVNKYIGKSMKPYSESSMYKVLVSLNPLEKTYAIVKLIHIVDHHIEIPEDSKVVIDETQSFDGTDKVPHTSTSLLSHSNDNISQKVIESVGDIIKSVGDIIKSAITPEEDESFKIGDVVTCSEIDGPFVVIETILADEMYGVRRKLYRGSSITDIYKTIARKYLTLVPEKNYPTTTKPLTIINDEIERTVIELDEMKLNYIVKSHKMNQKLTALLHGKSQLD
jgi:hypothetical protein